MIAVDIYDQDCHGVRQFRVCRRDGEPIFGRLQTDFPDRDDAIDAVEGELRRHKLAGTITLHTKPAPISWSAGGPGRPPRLGV